MFYRALVVFHRWLALILALFIFAIALSGAVVVFEGPIANSLAIHVATGRAPLSLDTLAARAVASVGGGVVEQIDLGGAPDRAFGFGIARGDSGRDVMMDPYTGTILPEPAGPTAAESFIRTVHQFHTRFLAGRTGQLVTAWVALGSLLLVLTGLTVWWREKLWRVTWSASWKRIVFDLHHALGFFASLVLLVITATGVWMGFERQIDPLVLGLNRTAQPTGLPAAPAPDPGATPVSLDSLVRAARAAVPGAPLMFMQLPPKRPVRISLRYPEDHTPGGRSSVFLDRYRGTVLRAASTRTAEAGTRLMNLQRPLHTGDIFGAPSQVIWFLASVILATQGITGVMMWWNSRAARRALRRAA